MALLSAVVLPVAGWGQSSSINAFSPYSMYGLGELRTPGTLQSRSMGGVGVAMRHTGVVNLLNPAAYSAVRPHSFLIDFEVEGQNFYNAQKYGGQTLRNSYNSVNFHDIAFQLPIAKRLGLGFSLTPYSSVGYRMKQEVEDDAVWGDIGRVQYQWEGDGDLTEVKLGLGWEPFKNFSIGAAAKYYWGDIQRTYRTAVLENITGGGLITDATGVETYSISRFQAQVGIQWSPINNRKRNLTVGAAYDIGGDLSPEVTTTVKTGDVFTSVAGDETERLALKLPHQVTAGVYYQTMRLALGADYTYSNWRGGNSCWAERSAAGFDVIYRNTHTVKLGVEYTPNRTDVRNVLKRWSYRAGVRYGNYCQSFGGVGIDEYAVTLGIGIPLRALGSVLGASSVNLGVEVGRRGGFDRINEQIGMVRQTYFKFAVGVTLFGDYWFVRPKYD